MFRGSMYLPSPSIMSMIWYKVNFLGNYVFTQPLRYEQNVTQDQFLGEYVFI